MLAVDPDHQTGGIGIALTDFALDSLEDAGMRVAGSRRAATPDTPRRTYE